MAASVECTTVLPGDILTDRVNRGGSKKYKLGPGLTVQSEDVVACKCGVLKSKENNTFWIDNHQKRVSYDTAISSEKDHVYQFC